MIRKRKQDDGVTEDQDDLTEDLIPEKECECCEKNYSDN